MRSRLSQSASVMQKSPEISPQQSWRALAALCTGLFITMMDQTLVAVALPRIREDLGASISQAVWVSAVYLLTFAVPLLISGRLGDRFGQRNVYLAGISLFTLGAVACALLQRLKCLSLCVLYKASAHP